MPRIRTTSFLTGVVNLQRTIVATLMMVLITSGAIQRIQAQDGKNATFRCVVSLLQIVYINVLVCLLFRPKLLWYLVPHCFSSDPKMDDLEWPECEWLFYLRQVNEVNGGDNVFVRCGSVWLCLDVRSGPVNQTSLKWALKRLKLRISNLIHVFSGTVRTWPLKFFRKGGVAMVTWPLNFGR